MKYFKTEAVSAFAISSAFTFDLFGSLSILNLIGKKYMYTVVHMIFTYMHAKIYIHFEYTLYTYFKWIRISCVTKMSCEIGLLTVYLQRLLDVQAPGSRCFGYESLKLLRHILQLAGKPKYWKVIPIFKQFIIITSICLKKCHVF